MSEPKSAPGSKPSSGGGGKKGGGGVAIAVGAVLIGAVVFGGPKIKAMLGGKGEVDAADSAEGKAGKKKRKVKRVVNGEEREVEEFASDDDAAAYDSTNPPVNPADRERWEKEREARLEQRKKDLEQYIHDSRLGPSTHSMGEEGFGYDGIVRPNARHESPLALRKFSTDPNSPKNPESREEQKKSKYAMLTGDVYNVYPGVPLVARLTVTQGNPSADPLGPPLEPIAVTLVSARLTKRSPDGKQTILGDFPLNDQGQFGDTQAGDRIYSGSLDPSKLKGLDGEVTLTAVFTVAGESGEYAVPLDWNVIAKPHATITGPKGDALVEGGSLDVYVGVNVNEPGQYHFQAVIADQKGANLGWAEGRPTLDRGAQTVTLNYYGLLFQEKKLDGPYIVNLVSGTHIHGARMDQTAAVPEWTGAYTTKPYKAAQFTSEQSQDPERKSRIAQMQDDVARNPGAVTKDGPDMILDESGNLVPGNGRALPPGSVEMPKETPKPALPAEPQPSQPSQPSQPAPSPPKP
jgi:hypothetical protein